MLILFLLPVFLLVMKTNTDNRQRAANLTTIKDITGKLIKTQQEVDGLSGKVKDDKILYAVSLAQKRKNDLLIAMKDNPSEVLSNAIRLKDKQKMDILIQKEIESEFDVTGIIRVYHTDDFKNRKSVNRYVLESVNSKDIKNRYHDLHFYNPTYPMRDKDTVRIRGIAINSDVAVQDYRTVSHNDSVKGLATVNPIGEQKIIAILVNFKDNPNDKPYSKEQIQSLLFGKNTHSSNDFYLENSNNKTWFNGIVTDWITLPITSDGCMYYSSIINPEVKAKGYDLDSYPRRIYFIVGPGCAGYSSYGSSNIVPSESGIINTIYSYVINHELGHNFSFNHANSIKCGSNAIADEDSCSRIEYGDPFGVMGTYELHHSSYYKGELNWISPSDILRITRSGIYTIGAQESTSSGFKALRIHKNDSMKDYNIEYRQPIGYDQQLATSPVVNGALIHIADYYKVIEQQDNVKTPVSFLIDTTPNTPGNFNDAALSDGNNFFDAINNIRITQMSHNASSVTLAIDIPDNQCVKNLPSISSSSYSASTFPDQKVVFNVKVINNDGVTCTPTSFSIPLPTYPTGWQYQVTPSDVTLSPGTSIDVQFTITPPYSYYYYDSPEDIKLVLLDPQQKYHTDFKYFFLTTLDPSLKPTDSITPSPTPTRTPTSTIKPTLKPTVTPTPKPSTFVTSYPSISGLTAGTTIGMKNTLIQVKAPVKLTQFAVYNAGSGQSFEIRKSSSVGEATGTIVTSGKLGTSKSAQGYYYKTLSRISLPTGYYLVRFNNSNGLKFYQGNTVTTTTDINFLKRSGGTNPATTLGAIYIKIGYVK